MILSFRKNLPAVALVLLALSLRVGLPASGRGFPLGHHGSPALTNEPVNSLETSLPDLSPALPGHSVHQDGLRPSRLSAVPLTVAPPLLLLATDRATRAPPA